ncbi:MAG: hypothetical protein R3344_05755, partial [Acidobacteriota bacterium]|nr:hypothetical protein [Acidobacteriota bacterium]
MRPAVVMLFLALVLAPTDEIEPLEQLRQMVKAGKYREAAERSAVVLREVADAQGTENATYLEALRLRVDSLSRVGRAAEPETAELVSEMLALSDRLDVEVKERADVHRTAAITATRGGDLGRGRELMERALEIAAAGLPEGDRTVTQLRAEAPSRPVVLG